jgi:pimeloyl-ACP methyl ester carboxylesterase
MRDEERGGGSMDNAAEWPDDNLSVLRSAAPRIVSTESGPVEYAEFGGGPAVLALHGALGGFDQGLILARAVGIPGFRYIGPSRPGYLGTPMASGSTPETEADLMAHLLDALGVPDAVVVAVSGGGPSAIHFTLRHRDRCRGLVLVSAASAVIEERIPMSFHVMKTLARVPGVARLMQRQTERDPAKAAGRSLKDPEIRRRTLEDPHTGPLLQALVLSTTDRMPLRLAGTDRDIRITREREYPLEAVKVPVLAVHGTADEAAPFAHAERLAMRVQGAELVRLEGGSHAGLFTHSAQVRAHVARFLGATAAGHNSTGR